MGIPIRISCVIEPFPNTIVAVAEIREVGWVTLASLDDGKGEQPIRFARLFRWPDKNLDVAASFSLAAEDTLRANLPTGAIIEIPRRFFRVAEEMAVGRAVAGVLATRDTFRLQNLGLVSGRGTVTPLLKALFDSHPEVQHAFKESTGDDNVTTETVVVPLQPRPPSGPTLE